MLSYVSLLTVSPVLCGLTMAIKQMDLCCSETGKDCSDGQTDDKPQKSSENNCCVPCCSVQNCHCYFVTPQQFDFSVKLFKTIQKLRLQNESLTSNYLSDCWNPPEFV
jgi:hypothetical protein